MKTAALITFPEGITPKQALDFLSEWQADLVKDANELAFDEDFSIKEYNPDHGYVVIYQP